MTGVLFVICIPRERYEKCMENSISKTTTTTTFHDLRNPQSTINSDSSESSTSFHARNALAQNLEVAVSIETPETPKSLKTLITRRNDNEVRSNARLSRCAINSICFCYRA